jgi:shikimate kinase
LHIASDDAGVSDAPKPPHLILVGLPGAGKSAHGRRVARLLNRPFVDLDHAIQEATGRTIADIFARDGEMAFRALEREATTALASAPASVIAPGGGWMMDPANVELVIPGAKVVWLKVRPAAAVKRMGARIALRPLLAQGDPVQILSALLEKRRSRYATADASVDTEAYGWHEVARVLAGLAPGSADA